MYACVYVYWSSWTVNSMGRDFRDRENILKGEEEGGRLHEGNYGNGLAAVRLRCSRNRVAMQRSLINSTMVVRTSGGRLDRPS